VSIEIIREAVAGARNPVMLYSMGKDSTVLLHLAKKAFHPAPLPFPLLHVDTTWKFRDMYAQRDAVAVESGIQLIVHVNHDGLAAGVGPITHGSSYHTQIMKTQALKQALDAHGFDVVLGGARRDEEKSRAKERVFSFRGPGHRWHPKAQRPELWNLYNTHVRPGESIRVFPLSDWTELDIWLYIYQERLPVIPLYFARQRPVVRRDGQWIMVDDRRLPLAPGEQPQLKIVRFRSLGCYPLSAAIESEASNLEAIIGELMDTRLSEREGRLIDSDQPGSMEQKKQEGYF
jgi:sulfate adenylyltransferase subunit 2